MQGTSREAANGTVAGSLYARDPNTAAESAATGMLARGTVHGSVRKNGLKLPRIGEMNRALRKPSGGEFFRFQSKPVSRVAFPP